MTLNVVVQNDLDNPKIPAPKQFQQWVDVVFQHIENRVKENVREVCIRVIDKTESVDLNKRFRQKLGATNVLSFSNDIDPNIDDDSLGDIAICADLVISEANDQGIPIEHHWAHLVVHGILHLLGYNHVEKKDTFEMEALEIKILKTLNIENPYQEPFSD